MKKLLTVLLVLMMAATSIGAENEEEAIESTEVTEDVAPAQEPAETQDVSGGGGTRRHFRNCQRAANRSQGFKL